MTNSMNAWFPALYLKKEAENRGLDSSELNTTMAMTMMLKGSPVMNMFLADSGLKRVEAEKELSESRTELGNYNAMLSEFRNLLKRESDGKPMLDQFFISIVEFILGEDSDEVARLKDRIKEYYDGENDSILTTQQISEWLNN